MIQVEVLFFASARELSGTPNSTLQLPEGSTVLEAARKLAELYPRLRGLLECCRFAVNEEFAAASDTLSRQSTLAVIPPVSGG